MAGKADWTAWVFQFAFGSVVGMVGALLVGGRFLGAMIFNLSALAAFVVGGGLLVGGAAAYWGDRWWLGLGRFQDKRSTGARSAASRRLGLGLMIGGGVIGIGALVVQFL